MFKIARQLSSKQLPNSFFQKVHTNGFLILGGEDSFAVFLNHRGLSNSSIANDHNLEERQELTILSLCDPSNTCVYICSYYSYAALGKEGVNVAMLSLNSLKFECEYIKAL